MHTCPLGRRLQSIANEQEPASPPNSLQASPLFYKSNIVMEGCVPGVAMALHAPVSMLLEEHAIHSTHAVHGELPHGGQHGLALLAGGAPKLLGSACIALLWWTLKCC